ncbi:protein O-linked-mannose beta-1,2-N-acetylglucosaminyltransferase 1-like [Penaeus japonicus]|uniref:protein O-linked-mannose beta-1,2-N-acetylglucosaminyltransferase 1-like n=1 Tax=Penaeus japonicus TaxID=27405 RepID=UPI001C70E6A1|nr:protein O-linked-mannose beta-1,2-N-acetylglucosaminyltransferase 1-like [Penaeus japonicus]
MSSVGAFVTLWLTASTFPAWLVPRAASAPTQLHLTVARPSGRNVTTTVTVEEEELAAQGISGRDVENTLIHADEEGVVHEAVVKGRRIPFKMNVQYEVHDVYNLKTEDNRDWVVSRKNFTNVTLEDYRDDPSLKPNTVPHLEWTPLPLPPPGPLQMSLTSSPMQATVGLNNRTLMSLSLNGTLPTRASGILPQGSGCHLLVLNPYTRRPTLQLYFNTNDHLIDVELVQTLENLKKGNLALLTTFYEASGRLKPPSRAALRSLGSWAAPHLKFRDYWAWAWRVGGSTVGEALVSSPYSTVDAPSPVKLQLDIDLHVNSLASERFCRDWPVNDLWKKRLYFCDLYDGYGDLCSCDDPFLSASAPPRMDTWREDIAVVIVAGSRPRYLYRLLRQLLTQPGMTPDLVLVSVDGEDEETIRLLEVLELRFLLHAHEGSFSSTRISRHLRFALFKALQTFPGIEKFILLEDDLLLAPDFYSYMQQTSQILHTDPSVLAVSAYSIFSAPHTARDLTRLNRVTSLPACGWMGTRTFLQEILPMWPPAYVRTAWDFWFWTDLVRQGRDIIVPEVPRTAHAGRYGTHASGHAAMTRDAHKPISTDLSARVDISGVQKEVFEEELLKELSRAVVLNPEGSTITSPCTCITRYQKASCGLHIISDSNDNACQTHSCIMHIKIYVKRMEATCNHNVILQRA